MRGTTAMNNLRETSKWALIAAFLLCAVAAQAATIKKKDGQIVEGKIVGLVVQKDEAKEASSEKHPGQKSYTVSYDLTNGSDITAIDEEGVHQEGRLVAFLVASQEGSPPDDADAVKTGVELPAGAFSLGQLKGDGTVIRAGGQSRDKRRVKSNRLVGQYRVDPATKKGTLEPSLEVATAGGTVKIPVEEIVGFKPKPEAGTKK
jgi:predicted porin